MNFILLRSGMMFLIVLLLSLPSGFAQEENRDALMVRKIYDMALTKAQCYPWLQDLTKIGGRLSGSPQGAAAVEYTRQMLDTLGLDSVWLQPCMVPHWIRGEKEIVRIVNSPKVGSLELPALALGNSVGTGPKGLTAEVIELQSLDDLERLGEEQIKGKIVFFNRPMDPRQIRTFRAYGGAVDQRGYGPARAGRYGAVAVLVRSMTTRQDDIPHTGSTVYDDGVKIPGIAISTNAADLLSDALEGNPVSVYVRTTCQQLSPKQSYNVIGEIRGTEIPEEYILVGGHLDSWDVGTGAHDDGAGCVHSMEVMHLIKSLDYRPRRSIRCVLFANEENGLAGGLEYAKQSNEKGEFHLAAIESDAGGFSPRGFSCTAEDAVFKEHYLQLTQWLPLMEPYGVTFMKGGAGADINPLKSQKGLLIGLRPDSQRYFDYHHTEIDQIEAVNQRELELGAAAMMSLVYLIDQHGLGKPQK